MKLYRFRDTKPPRCCYTRGGLIRTTGRTSPAPKQCLATVRCPVISLLTWWWKGEWAEAAEVLQHQALGGSPMPVQRGAGAVTSPNAQ